MRDRVLQLVRAQPGISARGIGSVLGISHKAACLQLYRLRDKGLVENRGSMGGGDGPLRPAGEWFERAQLAAPARVRSVWDLAA